MLGRKRKSPEAAASMPAASVSSVVPTAAERAVAIEGQLSAARADLAQAEAELLEARGEYERAVDKAAIEGAQHARTRIAEVEIRVDVARRAVERLAADHAEACAGAADAAAAVERERIRLAAEEAMREYERQFRKLPGAVAQFREVLRAWALAQLAHEAAADAGIALPGVDAFRFVPGRPREDIRSWESDLWIDSAGNPYEGRFQEKVKLQSDGTGRLNGPSSTTVVTRKRRYRFTEYRPRIDTEIAPMLAKELMVPALFAKEPAGYSSIPDRYDARSTLARLDALEQAQAAPRAEPQLKVERKPIEPARSVKIEREPEAPVMVRSMSGF